MDATESVDSALLALASSSSAPIWLHLLLADRCNHSCEHCYQVQGLKGELTQDRVEGLLREFRASGGFVVTFSGGEATLRDDLVPLLGYANRLGLATVLYTNGFTMTEGLAAAIAACHVWRVEISLYSDTAVEHDAVTRVAGSWARTVQGVRWLRSAGVNVMLKFTPTASATASAAQLAKLAGELDAHLFVSEMVNAGEAGRSDPVLARRVPEDAIGASSPTSRDANPLHGKPCGAGSQLSVRSDGMLQPCSQLQVSMGEVSTGASQLADAAGSEVARFFREVTWRDFPACRECDLRIHCRRCYASAATEAGDMLAPYPGACELAIARYRQATGKAGLIAAGATDAATIAQSNQQAPCIGPFHVEPNGDLRQAKTQHTAYDRALADRYPWLRPSHEASQASACGVDPARRERGLIQLRRPERSRHEGNEIDEPL